MEDYAINIAEIEEKQTLNNSMALENMFAKAKSAIVNGAKVNLIRRSTFGKAERIEEIDTLEDLEIYKKTVFKYLT